MEAPFSALEFGVRLISGRWKAHIIYLLCAGDQRFGELQRALPAISHKVLIQRLRELERDGILERQVIPGGPRHVRYALTASGRHLLPILELLRDWGTRHGAEKTDSRQSADSA